MAATRVGIIGYGVLGRQLERFIADTHGNVEIDWLRFDDKYAAHGGPGAMPFAEHTDDRFADLDLYVALGYRHLSAKEQVVASLLGRGRRLPPLIHPTAFVDPTVAIDPGVVVFPRCTIGSGVRLSAGVLLHCAVTLAHDDSIGPAAYIGPGVTVSGFVSIGARSFLGTGTMIANGVTVGTDATVGIATCVTRDVPANESVIGNPMRVLRRPLDLK